MGGPFKMKGFSGFGNSPMRQEKKRMMTKTLKDKPKTKWKGLQPGEGQGSKRKGKYIDMHGERDFSEHNIHARKTEGTIAQQDALRKANKKNK